MSEAAPAIKPVPTPEEAAVIATALELLWPQAAPAGADGLPFSSLDSLSPAEQKNRLRWRFSGRDWSAGGSGAPVGTVSGSASTWGGWFRT